MRKRITVAAVVAMTVWSLAAIAAVTPQEADHLGNDLTPLGAERVGNRDGSIPEWSGKEEAPAGWSWGKVRSEYSHFKQEKPLFSIDASNVDKHADKLAAGQVAMLKQIKGYRMDIYPTHRNCGVPSWVEERTKENATVAKLAADGWGLGHARMGGIPFPIPKNGAEAMWNYKLRYMGVGAELKNGGSVISPRPGTTNYVLYSWELTQVNPSGVKEINNAEDGAAAEFYIYFKYFQPAALAGQALIATSYMNKDAEISYYFPGQRRVRRMPAYTFDTPQIGFENQYTVDQNAMFWSTLDRFNYKLVGKKEMYVPNNALGMYDFKTPTTDVYQQSYVNPANRRYELHRVWVIEATVKPGVRHTFPKRYYYLDEDTWNQVVAEDDDASGKPWKLREAFQIPAWDLNGACVIANFWQYDVVDGRYMTDWAVAGQGQDIRFFTSAPDNRFKPSFYTAETLRAASER